MNNIERLNELNEKLKRNSKLNQHESEEAKKAILETLQGENNQDLIMKFIYLFPEEIGINTYFEYFKNSDKNAKHCLNNLFVNSEEFKLNPSGRSVNRATYLIGLMLNDNVTKGIIYLLRNLYDLMTSNKARKISDKSVAVFRKNILANYHKELFSISLERVEKDYFNIENMILNVAFKQINEELIKPEIQYNTLEWLLKSKRNIVLNSDERKLVQDAIDKNPIEFFNLAKDDTDFMNAYGHQLKFNIDTSTDKDRDKDKIKSNINSDLGDVEEVNDAADLRTNEVVKKPSLKEILESALHEAKSLEDEMNSKTRKADSLKESLDSTQKMYEEKLNENQQLNDKNQELKRNIESLMDTVESIRYDLGVSKEEISKLNIEKHEGKEKFSALLNMTDSEERNSLSEYKNKLSSKLKYLYKDFKETEDYPMNNRYGENLRDQMREIFDILIKQDINL